MAKSIEQSPDSFRKFKTESLGTDTVVEEVWSSPELKINILDKHTDPRYGEHTTRLTNLDTSEPSPLLFQVPPDHKVLEETDRVTLAYKRP